MCWHFLLFKALAFFAEAKRKVLNTQRYLITDYSAKSYDTYVSPVPIYCVRKVLNLFQFYSQALSFLGKR